MGGFMSAELSTTEQHASPGIAGAVWHSLVWLVIGNAIGVMLAILLLLPGLNPWLGEWTYGRWMMVHMNIALYGWCSLPMLGFLFKIYGADHGKPAAWCRAVLWLWSGALIAGSISWLSGQSSGKLFLDWTGYARVLFPLAMGALWLVLTLAFLRGTNRGPAARAAKIVGLIILAAVPFAIFFASSPNVYPAVNPDTGGPTGASQLESSLGIVLILLVLPFGVTRRNNNRNRMVAFSWIVFLAEAALWVLMNRGDISHHVPSQYLSLASLLVWLPLIPAYYAAFEWHAATRRWRIAMFWWWGGLVVSGWVLFLPGILDRIKFTDVLVGHSLTAVAGFLTALLVFVMIQLIGEKDAWIFNRTLSFHAWNMGVLAYLVIITIAGWIEGGNPAFTIVPGAARDILYFVRLLTGIAMLAGSSEWLVAASRLPALATPARAELSGVRMT
jgi:cytochrome c oxidase cbb3-type subunit 1